MRTELSRRIKYYDIAAVLLCVLLFLFFFHSIRYGIGYADESLYLSVAQRFVKGDRPFVDEWHISQLTDLLLVPLYRIFHSVTGGTDGIIIYMRQVFLALNFLFFLIMYRSLRPYGGLLAAVILCAFVPAGMFAVNYYTMTPRLMMLICVVLFLSPKALSRKRLMLVGVLLSFAVLFEPPLALLYLLYSLDVLVIELVRKKRPEFAKSCAFLCSRHCWFWITAAVAVCAVVFLAYLHWKSDLRQVFATLPELLTDSEYDFSQGGNGRTFLLQKLQIIANVFGKPNAILTLIVCVGVGIYAKVGNRRRKYFWFCMSNCLLISCSLYPIILQFIKGTEWFLPLYYYFVAPVPLFAFGLVNYLLCEKKEPRLFMIWLTGGLSSFFMDLFSDTSFGMCGILSIVPGTLCFGQILKEFRAEREQSNKPAHGCCLRELKRNRRLLLVSKLTFLAFLVVVGVSIYLEGTLSLTEKSVDVSTQSTAAQTRVPAALGKPLDRCRMQKIEVGPLKGIYTTPEICKVYGEALEDLDEVKQGATGPVYLAGFHPLFFLYLDLPSANCSSWNRHMDRDRQLRYFALHPEKTPQKIYYYQEKDFFADADFKKSSELFLQFSKLLCDGSVTQARRGVIVEVERWKDPLRPEVLDWVVQNNEDF